MAEVRLNNIFWPTLDAWVEGKRYVISKGGSRSGKTYSNLQLLHFLAKNDNKPTITSVVAMTMPHLRKGAIRDFIKIVQSDNYFNNTVQFLTI